MSRRLADQARRMLEESIAELGALRNAHTRDPQFKQWRQNALTLIQRLYPGDAVRSDRFRRVPFSPPSSKTEGKQAREWFERGCAEAAQVLRSMVDEIDARGLVAVDSNVPSETFEPGTTEDDFPTLDLPGGPPPAPRAAAPPPAEIELPKPAARRGGARREPASLEDTLREVTGSAPRAKSSGRPSRGNGKSRAKARLKDMLGLADLAAPADAGAREAPRSGAASARAGDAARAPSDEAAPIAAPPAAPTPPPAASAPPPAPPVVAAPEPPARAESAPPAAAAPEPPARAESAPPDAAAPEPPVRAESAPPVAHASSPHADEAPPAAETPEAADDVPFEQQIPDWLRGRAREPRRAGPAPAAERPAVERRAPKPDPREARLDEPDDDLAAAADEAFLPWDLPEWSAPAASARPPAAAPPPVPAAAAPADEQGDDPFARDDDPPPAAETPSEGPDDADAADEREVMADFMSRSPVLGAHGRPVARSAAAAVGVPAPFGSPTAAALAAIAAELESLGVPEARRARTRAALLDLARQIEAHELRWDVLREAVVFLVDHPPLARRVLPLLVPHLDLAA